MGQEALNNEVTSQPVAEKLNLNKVEGLAPIVSIETKLSQAVSREDKELLKEKISKLNDDIAEIEEKLEAKKNTNRDHDGQIPTTVYLGDTEITPELLNEKKEELSKLKETTPPKPKVKRTFLGALFNWLP